MLSGIDKFKEFLNTNSLKSTKERLDIAKAVVSFKDFFTVDELLEKINNTGWPVSKATLYRSIPLLIESGMIKPITSNQLNNHTFKRCKEGENVELFGCEKCGIELSVKDEMVNDIHEMLSEKYDFIEIIDKLLLLKGICPSCVDDLKKTSINKLEQEPKLRIFLFEDEDMVRTLIVEFLEKKGYEVFAYSDPSKFNNKCICNKDQNITCADFLITDIKMPNITGVKFLENQIGKNCRIGNIAFISAYWTLEDLDYAGKIGAAIFHKPFNIIELNKWLDSCREKIQDERVLGNEFLNELT